MKEFYLDHAATSPVLPAVLEQAMPYLQEHFGNPSSLHRLGAKASSALEESRETLQKMLHVQEVIWTSGGTESVHLALWGIAFAPTLHGKELLLGELEHPCVLASAFALERFGFVVKLIPYSKEGVIQLDILEQMISPETRLIACTALHNELGTIQPLSAIRQIISQKKHQIILFSDCVQALGKMDFPNCADVMAVSGHKIGATKGIGALLFKNKLPFTAMNQGGSQENEKRGGTENVFGAVSFASALKSCLAKDQQPSMQKLHQSWKQHLLQNIPQLWVYSSPQQNPYYLMLALPQIPAEVFLHHLEAKNIFVSAGSACSSRKKLKLSTLEKIGFPSKIGRSAVRFSFAHSNLDDEKKEVWERLEAIVAELTQFL